MNPAQEPSNTNRSEQNPPANSDLAGPKGEELRLHQRVTDTLARTPGGDSLDKFFGITTGKPEQSDEDRQNSDALIRELQAISNGESLDLTALVTGMSKHVADSAVDPDALRALMRSSKKARISPPDADLGEPVPSLKVDQVE